MSSNQKDPKKTCDELKEAYKWAWRCFHEDDVPVFLEYEHLPPERCKQKGLIPRDESERDIEFYLVKSHELHLLEEGYRKEIRKRAYTSLLEQYSPCITKGWTNPLNIYTCEEALSKGYQKTIHEIILQMRCNKKRNRWFERCPS